MLKGRDTIRTVVLGAPEEVVVVSPLVGVGVLLLEYVALSVGVELVQIPEVVDRIDVKVLVPDEGAGVVTVSDPVDGGGVGHVVLLDVGEG